MIPSREIKSLSTSIQTSMRSIEQYETDLNPPDIEIPPLSTFVAQAWRVLEPGTPFVNGWHIDAICEHLTAISNGDITRLLINMPPRHAKSTLVSVIWPVWSWLKDPSIQWLCASYALNLAIRDNRKARLLIQSPWFQANYGHIFRLSGDQNVKGRFENNKRGYRMATSVGAKGTTGEGGTNLLIDDAHPAADATSQVNRHRAIEWFDETWSSRLNNPQTGAMAVCGQCIHSNDLSNHILELGGWEHLCLPTEFESDRRCVTSLGWSDPRTQEGELLWPSRFNQEAIARLKKQLGSMAYAAQMQQRPVPAEGGQFKQRWLRYYTANHDTYELQTPTGKKHIFINNCWTFLTVDLAISLKQMADYTVICAWCVTPDNELLLLDRFRERIDNPTQQQTIALWFQRFNPQYAKVESNGYQLALIQQLLAQGYPVMEFRAVTDKMARASTAAVFYENGMIYHPQHASWLHEWEGELLKFPLAENDDQVDNASMAADAIRQDNVIRGYTAEEARYIRGF